MKKNKSNFQPVENVTCCLCHRSKTKKILTVEGLNIVKCLGCGLMYVNPRYTSQHLKMIYNQEYFRGIGERHFNEAWRAKVFRPIVNEMISITGLRSGKILDVGTATGYFLKQCQKRGFDVAGVEPSSKASRFAREQLKLPVKTGTLLTTHWEKSAFDIITMNDVIEHMPDPRQNLELTYRSLKPGGWLIISTPNIDSLGFKVFKEGFVFIAPQVHLWYFSPKTLVKLLELNGFSVKKIIYPYFNTPFFNLRELINLGINIIRKLILTPSQIVPSAPWYGNVIKVYAQKI